MSNKALKKISPFDHTKQLAQDIYKTIEQVWIDDKDDLVEDATKIIGLYQVIKIANYFNLGTSSTSIFFSAAYLALNQIGDWLGEFIDSDDNNKEPPYSNNLTFKGYACGIASDLTEDSTKLGQMFLYWAATYGAPLIVKNGNIFIQGLTTITTYSFAVYSTLRDYNEINKLSNAYGVWAEEIICNDSPEELDFLITKETFSKRKGEIDEVYNYYTPIAFQNIFSWLEELVYSKETSLIDYSNMA
jgi:hypothetical protein